MYSIGIPNWRPRKGMEMNGIERIDSALHDVGEIADDMRKAMTTLEEGVKEWAEFYAKRNPDSGEDRMVKAEWAFENLLAVVQNYIEGR